MINLILSAVFFVMPYMQAETGFDYMTLNEQKQFIEWRRGIVEQQIILPAQYYRPSRPIEPEWMQELVAAYFQPEDVEWALRVSWCESHWDAHAKNPSSSASGLFQHLARFWPERSTKAGWGGADIFDPIANTAVAAWLFYLPEEGGPGHWACK